MFGIETFKLYSVRRQCDIMDTICDDMDKIYSYTNVM